MMSADPITELSLRKDEQCTFHKQQLELVVTNNIRNRKINNISLITDLANYQLSWYSALPVSAALCTLIVGLYAIKSEHFSKASLLYFLMSLSIVIWLGSFGIMYSSINEAVASFWGKTAFLGISFITILSYHITVKVFQIAKKRKLILWLGWVLSFAFAIMIATTDIFIKTMIVHFWGYYPRFTAYGYLFIAFFIGLMC